MIQIFRYLLPFVIISLAYSLAPSFPHSENITVSVPQDSTNHSNSRLVCTPSIWTDVVGFFILYLVTPAATVKSLPGQSTFGGLFAMCSALLFPTASVGTGISAVLRCAALQSSPLLKAQKAGALCEVVRADDWEPQHGDYVRCLRDIWSRVLSKAPINHARLVHHSPIRSLSVSTSRCIIDRRRKDLRFKLHDGNLLSTGRLVHGICRLPPGYELSIVDPKSTLLELKDDYQFQLGPSYSLFKGVMAIAHLVSTSILLYKTRGDQFHRYRLSAFGLIVIPYFFMSLVNMMGSILTPDYPAVYMVKTEIMIEAERRDGAFFEGVVGTLGDPERPINAEFRCSKQKNRRYEIPTYDNNRDTRPEEDAAQVRTAHEYSPFTDHEYFLLTAYEYSLTTDEVLSRVAAEFSRLQNVVFFIPASHTYLGRDTLQRRSITQFLTPPSGFRLEDFIVLPFAFSLRAFFPDAENVDLEVFFSEGWILFCMVASHIAGRLLPVLDDCIEPPWKAMRNWSGKTLKIICATAVVLTICGFVIRLFVFTGQMIMDYGHCVLVD